MPDLHVAVSGSGAPALLVHGSMSFGALAFSEQRPLADEFELRIVDRRGFGRSPGARGRADFAADADDVAVLLDDRSHLLGHSYGGIVCMLAAERRPEGVRSLTVIEPPAFSLVPGDPAVAEMGERVAAHLGRTDRDEEEFLDGFLRAWGFEPGRGQVLNRVARRSVRRSMGERPPSEAVIPVDELARASFPVLVVRGAWDAVPAAARDLAGHAFAAVCDVLVERVGAQSAVFPGAAHQPQLLGGPFNRRLAAFWHAADRSPAGDHPGTVPFTHPPGSAVPEQRDL